MHLELRKRTGRARIVAGALLSLFIVGFAGTARGAGQYVKVEYPASTVADELQVGVTYTLWIPDGVKTLRGIIVHQHGAGTTASREGSTAAYDLHWQALARKWDCALLGPSYHVLNEKVDISPGASELWFDPRRGSDKVFLKGLADLAAKTQHPELTIVPWCLWGHSGGGIWSNVMATLHPERVAAIWLRSGTAIGFITHVEFKRPDVPAAMYSIPTMANPGVKEKPAWMSKPDGGDKLSPEAKVQGAWAGSLATFKEYRAKGAPIGFAPDPRSGHETADSRYLAIPFFDACLAMRLPEKGSKDQTLKPVDMSKAWLAPLLEGEAQPANAYKGNPSEAVWLPNEAVAKVWMEYVKIGAVGDTTPPPAPTNVHVSAKDDKSEITWEAEADLESGIRCFIVLRDGQELAQMPKTPVGKYGRPLFQSMTYHDTPSQPLPEMRYVDASAKPDDKHTYAVITVNSVELKSEPSAKATLQQELPARGDEGLVRFDGEKSSWHGFDRYDFLMDETNLTIEPYKVAPDEQNAVKAQVKGQRRCVVVVPKAAAPGNPWSWQGCYWDHQPQAEVELLKRGFHIAFAAPDAGAQGKVWDTWYKFLTEKHGLAKKAAFIGMSKGGVNEFNWGVVNPDKVACIYADNTALYDEDFAKLSELAKHDIPLLLICGTEDFLLQRHTRVVENTYHQLGGLITVIIKEGHAHHPHSLQNAKPIADWIEQHMTPSTANRPAFVDATFTKGYYYSLAPSFIYLKEEETYATARGPGFTECYDRYDGPTSGKFRMGGISIIVPKTVAPGKPWVFTGDPIERDATVEQALLAKGYHILILSPLGSGMTQKQWDDAYKLLMDNGFSNKPVLKGTGSKGGEAFAWAVANPGKVSCIYARNPLMHSLMAGKQQPIDNLAALAQAGVPVLHDCGALDPWLDSQTRVVEKRYKELDGKITVIVRSGEGHFPLSPKDPKPVIDFIIENAPTVAAQAEPTAVQVNSQAPTYLYGGQASKLEGDVKKKGGDNFAWKGNGAVTWEVQIAKSGEYAVGLCHAAEPGAAGQEFQIAGGGGHVTYTLRNTEGVFRGNMAYEIVPVMGLLTLAAGKQTITLSITNAPAGKPLLAFRSLELTPLSAKAAIEADRQEARRSRASTEWLNKAGYGLMFHWTSQSVGMDGANKPFAQAVADFPLDRFVEMVEATGAGYVLFTVGHAQPYCPAPLTSWEKYFPGKTTKRDLIAEMAQALNAKGIRLMCYFPAHVIGKYPRASSQEFTQMTTDILQEFGERYGEKVAGYWFDGFYQCFEKYPGFSFRNFYEVCKAGNSQRIIAVNSWIYPSVTEWQDYWAGEVASPVGLPVDGTNARGPGQGLRYHALLIMEPYWVQQKVEMPKPQFDAQRLGDYISQCMANGGAVTINLGIYQDGSVDPRAVDVLKDVRQRIRKEQQ